MADPSLDFVDQTFIDYFTNYFSTASGGLTASGTWHEDWKVNITSQSGVAAMTNDLMMMTEGLSKNFNVPDRIVVLSGTAIGDLDDLLPDTDTSLLFENLKLWKDGQDTIYGNYLYGKMIEVMISNEPTTKLSKWFDLDATNADILWNLLVLYKEEGTNLEDTYIKAVQNHESEEKFIAEHNI